MYHGATRDVNSCILWLVNASVCVDTLVLDQAGYGRRTACRCRRQPHREPSSTPSPAGFSLVEKTETLRRLVHPQTKLAVANEQRAVVGDGAAMRPVPLDPCSQRLHQKTEKLLLRRVHPHTKPAMANKERAVVGDGPAVRPVPLLLRPGFRKKKRKKTYVVLYIHKPS